MDQNLLDIIKNKSGVAKWDAIERLMERHTLKEINDAAGYYKNGLNKWRHRQRKAGKWYAQDDYNKNGTKKKK